MVSAAGISAHGAIAQPSYPGATDNSVAALEGRIQQDQIQLNDWTTCVSAKTPTGQAAIQKLAGEISAVKEQISRSLQASSGGTGASVITDNAPVRSGSLDVWA